jgi:xylulose-5-phosphate/fructose-6-phosphate phosphoketolase
MRYVNINALSGGGLGNSKHLVLRHEFEDYFTEDKPVRINFHGYPQTIKQVLFDYGGDASRFTVHGYEESGSTTTAFDMMVRNHVDRYHLAMEAFAIAEHARVITAQEAKQLRTSTKKSSNHTARTSLNMGMIPLEITNWTWHSR